MAHSAPDGHAPAGPAAGRHDHAHSGPPSAHDPRGHAAPGSRADHARNLEPWQLSPRKRAALRHVPANEEIFGIYHPHVIVFLRSLWRPGIPLVLLLFLYLVLNVAAPTPAPPWLQTILAIASLVMLLALFAALLWVVYLFFDWRADHLVITDQRIVMNIETPGIRRLLREVPMGKVQNVISHHASIDHPVDKALGVATLIIDTAGLGQVVFHDVREQDAHDARTIILALQGGVRSASRASRENYRQAVVDSILYGKALPPQPQRIEVRSYPRTGYNLLNVLLPLRPWREGLQVTWHRHWWFLIANEARALLTIFVFELTALVVGLVSRALGAPDNAILNTINIIRPLFYLVMIPVMLWLWDDWRNDRFILDKDRLLTIDQRPLGFSQVVKETEIRRVVDATVSVDGALPNLLRFGDVVMKTPGESTEFRFEGVPSPFRIHQEIMTRIEAEREREQAQWDRDIQEWLRTYVEARRAEPQQAPPPAADYWPWPW